MPIKKRWLPWVFFVAWIATTAILLCLQPVREQTQDVTQWWRYLRLSGYALAYVTLGMSVGVLALYYKRLLGFLPAFRKYFPLLTLLVRRDFLVKYKRSVLGILWSLLNPLANMVILSIVFSQLFRATVPYFPAFVLSGSLMFACFAEATQTALFSIVSSSNLIRKVYLPKYIFPISKVITAFVNFLFSLIALLLVMLAIRVPFHASMAAAPVIMLYLLLFCTGTGLLLATAYTFFRDTMHLYGVMLTAMNYLSAVFFDVSIVPARVMPIFALNPMYHYIRVFRFAMLYGQWPTAFDHVLCAGVALVMLGTGLFVFYRKQDAFILHL